MAYSAVEITNMALGWLGATRITSLQDNEDCNLSYPACRDACLEDVDWTFATERLTLSTPASEGPDFDYTYKFLLPQRVLRVISVNENIYDWDLEQRYILTDQTSCEVKAIVRIENTAKFPASFIQMLAARLAAVLAPSITSSKATSQHWWGVYGALKAAAQGNDGRQGITKQMKRRTVRGRHSL